MTIAAQIIDALGGPTKLHRKTGIPVQTIWDWKDSGNIPHWRRSTLIEAAKKLPEPLDPQQLAYLASADPAPKVNAA
jgi:hypothetical protein